MKITSKTNYFDFFNKESVLSAASEIVFVLSFFISIKILVNTAGLGGYGLWSFVMGVSVIARLFDFSGGGNLTRILSVSRKSELEKNNIVDTYFIIILIQYLLFMSILFFIFYALSFDNKYFYFQDENYKFLIIAMACTVLNVVQASQLSSLDGFSFSLQRAYISIFSSILLIFLCFIFVPFYGLSGFGASVCINYIITIFLCRFYLFYKSRIQSFFPIMFNLSVARENLSYGFLFEISERPRSLFDPLYRMTLGLTLGFEKLAVFDLAYKIMLYSFMVVQSYLRPNIALISSFIPNYQRRSVLKTLILSRDNFYIIIFFYFLLIIGSPLISIFLLGGVDEIFLKILSALAFGFSVASLAHFSTILFRATGEFKSAILVQFFALIGYLGVFLWGSNSDDIFSISVLVSFIVGLSGLAEWAFFIVKYKACEFATAVFRVKDVFRILIVFMMFLMSEAALVALLHIL